MKKLRLLITKQCNRNCEGCCNKEYDLDALPICTSFNGYDEIILTGGEPMLKVDTVLKVIKKIRKENSLAKIYMYTAKADVLGEIYNILDAVDGMTLTLHEQTDVEDFLDFQEHYFYFGKKSLRLNVFDGVYLPKSINLNYWKVRKNIKWIKNCPLPKDEVFMRLGEI
jgi:hypothetical protein